MGVEGSLNCIGTLLRIYLLHFTYMYVGTNKYTEKERERAVVGFESPEVNHRFEGKTRIQP